LIGHFYKIKLRDYNQDQFLEVSNALKVISVNSGVNEPLEDYAAQDMLRFIKIEFKDFSFSEIREAFGKYNSGKLAFKNGAYQNFSQKFVGDVLRAYKVFRNKALLKYYKALEAEENKKEATEEEIKEIENNFLEKFLYKPYRESLENGSKLGFTDDIGTRLFRKLYSSGKISVSKGVSGKYNTKAKDSLRKSLIKNINSSNKKQVTKLIEELNLVDVSKDANRRIKERSANLFFTDWINEQAENRVKLEGIKI
jgi:hypothetical protein